MAMAMDEEELLQEEEQEDLWCLQLQRGEKITLIPWDDQPFVVTDVFLVDPESAAGGQGVVSAWVETGTRKVMLAQLSSEVTDVELQTPVVLDEEFSFYVIRPDTDAEVDADKDAIVVQFEGFVLSQTDEDTYEESEEDEEAASSEEDDDGIEEESEEDEESDGEVDGDVARASNAKE